MTGPARIALLAGAVAALAAAPPAARATQTALDRVGQAWQTDPVYVDPGAEGAISAADADRVRRAIADRRAGPMYVAIVPATTLDEAGGSAAHVADAAYGELHRDGTYAVMVGDRFAAEATDIGGVAAAADDASSAHQGTTAVLLDFTARVGKLRAADDSGSGDGGNGPGGLGTWLALGLAALGGLALLLTRRRGRDETEEVD